MRTFGLLLVLITLGGTGYAEMAAAETPSAAITSTAGPEVARVLATPGQFAQMATSPYCALPNKVCGACSNRLKQCMIPGSRTQFTCGC